MMDIVRVALNLRLREYVVTIVCSKDWACITVLKVERNWLAGERDYTHYDRHIPNYNYNV